MIVAAVMAGLITGWLILRLADMLPRFANTPPEIKAFHVGAVEAFVLVLSAAAFGVLWLRFGRSAEFAVATLGFAFFVLIALIDLRYRLVLNVMTYPAMLAALLVHMLAGTPISEVIVGGMFAFFIFFGAAIVSPGGLGMGDVKLAVLLGLTFGFPGVLWALIVGVGAGGVVAIWLIARRYSLTSAIPYAPFLCLGALVALVYNPLLGLL